MDAFLNMLIPLVVVAVAMAAYVGLAAMISWG